MTLSRLSFLITLLLTTVAEAHELITMCKDDEREALFTFKRGLRDNYGALSSWGDEDCCKWTGVKCNNHTGQVVILDLHGMQLGALGTITPSLLHLQHLTRLNLAYVDFNGAPLPEFLGSFRELRTLNLFGSNFSGPIPHQLGNLSKLRCLDLRGNNLYSVGNLEPLSHLSNLKILALSYLNLSQAQDWAQLVNQFPLLESLMMESCDLPSTIPPSLSLVNSSKFLTNLLLSSNSLTSSVLYPWLFNISTKLVQLDLSDNLLKGPIPEGFGNMNALRYLNLYTNQLEGSIPVSLRNLCHLQEINLSSNNISGHISRIVHNLACTEHSLEELYLNKNQITGSIPDQITRFSSLTALEVGYNNLNGSITEKIGRMSNLEALNLRGNSLSGMILDAHFSELSRLDKLDLSHNSLTLNFSLNWVPPFQVRFLRLGSCKLGPHFPRWLQFQKNLVEIDISAAGISGTIPKWFGELSPSMSYLNLSGNQIHGTSPKLSWSPIDYGAGLDLMANQLEGPLPFLPPNAVLINLSSNKFSGSISGICKIDGGELNLLDLSDNLFSGTIPDCFSQWPKLEILNLSNNNFSGQIPSSVGSLIDLKMLNLHNNYLSGGFPCSLNNSRELMFMDLSDNNLSGEIPFWIGQNLQSLVFLSLHANQFNDNLPQEICGLKNIRILDLSFNQISGLIPKCLNNFTAMTQNENLNTVIQHYYNYIFSSPINGDERDYIDKALLVWKGKENLYTRGLGFLIVIDLSSNKLTGEIPREIASLSRMVALNLSRNLLTGKIPEDVGQLKQLQVLDLSRNQLLGNIPSSMAELTFLNHLDLSYNKLYGRIPSSTQLGSFDPSVFSGNLALCGRPLAKICPGDDGAAKGRSPSGGGISEENDNGLDSLEKWFFLGMGLGFPVGFWGFLALLLKRSWRFACFRLLDRLEDWLYVNIFIQMSKFKRKIHQ